MENEVHNSPPTCLSDLAPYQIWLGWKGKKIPFDPKNGRPGSSTDPQTWGILDQAIAWSDRNNAQIGIVLGYIESLDHVLAGIDLDTCLSDGQFTFWAQEVINHFRSYTEISPSGTGAKAFFFLHPDKFSAILGLLHRHQSFTFKFGSSLSGHLQQ